MGARMPRHVAVLREVEETREFRHVLAAGLAMHTREDHLVGLFIQTQFLGGIIPGRLVAPRGEIEHEGAVPHRPVPRQHVLDVAPVASAE